MTSNASFTITDRRPSSSSEKPKLKFPDFDSSYLQPSASAIDDKDDVPSPGPGPLPDFSKLRSAETWSPKDRGQGKSSYAFDGARGGRHGRQKSLSEALQTVRTRRGSVSQNAAEIAKSLKPPVSAKLVILCLGWYACSILSNASSKAILIALPKPVTLTVVQFAFVCGWCIIAAWLARIHTPIRNAIPVLRNGIRSPDRHIIYTTLPLTAFQIGGHILNSDAMARIPVSLVHTIKGLSPLFTVLAYRIFFSIRYSIPTYLSLIPLTLGVIMACSASFRAEFVGLIYAFGSALLFVTQNIVSKTLFTEAAKAEADGVPNRHRKPDKLNLLCYSSGLALLFTLPIWLWSEGFGLVVDFFTDASVELSGRPGSLDHGRLALEFAFNGVFHFTQSLVAFVLLGMTSPVTYSVASLIKRVFVIVFAILWFGNPMTNMQASGIALTIVGLYLYDRTSDADKADRRLREQEAGRVPLLPLQNGDAKRHDGVSPLNVSASGSYRSPLTSPRDIYVNGVRVDVTKKRDDVGGDEQQANAWLARGTKQEDTWTPEDVVRSRGINVR